MERLYFEINETTARAANNMNSMRDYLNGTATEIYKRNVNRVYDIVEEIAEKKPNLLEKAKTMADRYSRKLASHYNDYYRNEASCPSVLVSGAGNFPTRKKEKQNNRRSSLIEEWNYLEEYAKKIINLLTMKQPIRSGDENAIELLEAKLEQLQEEQDIMKNVNAYYRKNGTLDGCPDLTEVQIEKLKSDMEQGWHMGNKPFESFHLANNSASIRNTQKRLESLKKSKEAGNQEIENKFFKVVMNTDIMRLQLFFDGKPDDEVRNILKKNAFKWSPKNGCWQRQLTSNATYAVKSIIKELEKTVA